MKVKTLWIVMKPTGVSEMYDICYSADVKSLQLHFLGGLKPENIWALYTTEKEARTVAKWLLDHQADGQS